MKKKQGKDGDAKRGMISMSLLLLVSLIVAPFTSLWIPLFVLTFILVDFVCVFVYLILRRRKGNLFFEVFAPIDKINGFDFFRF